MPRHTLPENAKSGTLCSARLGCSRSRTYTSAARDFGKHCGLAPRLSANRQLAISKLRTRTALRGGLATAAHDTVVLDLALGHILTAALSAGRRTRTQTQD